MHALLISGGSGVPIRLIPFYLLIFFFIANRSGSYSVLGVEAQNNESLPLAEDEPTTVLAIDGKPEKGIQHIILHEFGHILGLCHEHQHPDYVRVMKQFVDEKKCYSLWHTPINQSINDFKRQHGELGLTVEESNYDKRSIMHYP